jgi:signal peptidase II
MQYWTLGGILFFCDMSSKWLAKFFLASGNISLIPHFFQLKLAFNTGIAFSLPIPKFLQIFLTLAFFTFFFFWAKKYFSQLHSLEKWGSVFLLAGALGNFWERVVFGAVTDFLSFSLPFSPYFSFPIFNLADVFIFAGVVLWLWGYKKNTQQ